MKYLSVPIWIRDWFVPRGGLDFVENGKVLAPAWNRNPAVQHVSQCYTGCATLEVSGERKKILNYESWF
jgi:hypothetical protein